MEPTFTVSTRRHLSPAAQQRAEEHQKARLGLVTLAVTLLAFLTYAVRISHGG